MNLARGWMLAVLIGVYALCYPLIRVGSEYAAPLDFALLRSAVAIVAALLFAMVRNEPLLPPVRSGGWIAALGLCTTAQFAAMFPSPAAAGTSVAVVLGNTGPLFALFLGHVVLHEEVGKRALVALGLGLAGVASIAWTGEGSGSSWGWVVPLAAAAAGAAGAVIFKRSADATPTTTVVAGQFIVATLGIAVVRLAVGGGWSVAWTAPFAASLLTLGLLGSALASGVWYKLLRHGQVARLSLHLLAVPAIGLLLSRSFLGDTVTRSEALGLVLCLAALVVLQWPADRRAT